MMMMREGSNVAEKVDRGDQTGDSLLLARSEVPAAVFERESPKSQLALTNNAPVSRVGDFPPSHGAFELQLGRLTKYVPNRANM